MEELCSAAENDIADPSSTRQNTHQIYKTVALAKVENS